MRRYRRASISQFQPIAFGRRICVGSVLSTAHSLQVSSRKEKRVSLARRSYFSIVGSDDVATMPRRRGARGRNTSTNSHAREEP
jgi:hypothetical protein